MVALREQATLFDPAPGQWEIVPGTPDARLRAHVLNYDGYVDSTYPAMPDRHLPGGFVPMIIGLGEPLHMTGTDEEHSVFVAGMQESATFSRNIGVSYGVQVNLTPIGAHEFLGVSMDSLTNRVIDLEDVLGTPARDLVERLREARSWDARFAMIDEAMLDRLGRATPASPAVGWAWRRLSERHGSVAVGDLADAVGWSRKHLIAKFREQIGVPPKTLARILRFNRALRLLDHRVRPSWTEIAYRSGYYDQAHFNRDFRELAGATPTQILEERRASRPVEREIIAG